MAALLKSHVFISYKTEEKGYVQPIIDRLQKVGINVWIAPDSIPPGEKWEQEIDTAIEQAFALIVILTPKSVLSQWVTYEWMFALSMGKKVYTLKFEPFDDLLIHEKLKKIQCQNLIEPHNRAGELDRLVAALQDVEKSYSPATLPIPRNAPPSVKQAIVALDSYLPSERITAVQSLAQINHPTSIATLTLALGHHYRDVRIYAAFELAEITPLIDEKSVPPMIEALGYDKTREHAKNLLVRTGAIAVPSLVSTFQSDASYYVQDAISAILLEIGQPTIPYMVELLKHDNRDVRLRAVRFLDDTKDEDATHGLVQALDDLYDNIRLIAAQTLGKRKSESAIPKLKALLADNAVVEGVNHPISFHASVALYRIGTQEAYDAIIPYLKQQLSNTKLLNPGFGSKRVCDEVAEILDLIGTSEDKAFVEEWRRNQNKSDD